MNEIASTKHPFIEKIKVTHLPSNLGVSGAWNLIMYKDWQKSSDYEFRYENWHENPIDQAKLLIKRIGIDEKDKRR